MGLLYIVHRLNPDIIGRVRSEYERNPDLAWSGAVDLFRQVGRLEPPDGAASSWDEYQEMFDFERWNLVLTIAASEASWDLDKSLDRPGDGLPAIARLLPELASIRTLLSAMESLDGTELPKAFQPPEMGLMGIATSDVVRAAVTAASKYSQPEARGQIAAAPVPLLKRLLGGGVTLSSWRGDDYLWNNWLQLLNAIQQAGSRGHWLGLEMR
jgi:hypothetical protein